MKRGPELARLMKQRREERIDGLESRQFWEKLHDRNAEYFASGTLSIPKVVLPEALVVPEVNISKVQQILSHMKFWNKDK